MTEDDFRPADAQVPSFDAPYAPPDEDIAAAFLQTAPLPPAAEARIDARAGALVGAIRAHAGGLGGVEDFLREYSLSTKEGLALMVLAEALLRVPDAATADRLIEDKLAGGRWLDGDVKSTALLVAASRQAMHLLASHFVMGRTIEEALARAKAHPQFSYSFDMLGEGARTSADAENYFDAYAGAIAAIGADGGNKHPRVQPGISVKLSALHPHYEAISRERVREELTPRLIELAELAKA